MPENYICGKCGKVAKTKQALERHAAYHEDDRPFSCEVCLQRFKNSDDRGKHYRRLKKDGKFGIACTVCHKHFKTQQILQKHTEMLGCNVSADFVNTSEDAATSKISNDKEDVVAVKEEYIPGDGISCNCRICETEFVNPKYLKRHYKDVHNDTKRQVCIQCGQTLSSKDSLARHFSIFHQTSYPFSCDVCNQKFKIKESLCRHVKFVHQDGGYQCPECNRVFTQPVNLKKHLAVHSAQKEYACKFCGREFRWKQALQKHELLHGAQSKCTKTQKEDSDEVITEFQIEIDDSEMPERKNSEDNVIDVEDDDITLVEDITDKYIGRKLKHVTDKEIGSNLMCVDISSEQSAERKVLSKKLNNIGIQKYSNHTASDSCSSDIDNVNVSTSTAMNDNTDQRCSFSEVSDEYEFKDEEVEVENNRQRAYSCQSDRSRQMFVQKRMCDDRIGYSHDKKKLKVDNGPFVHSERMSLVAENNEKNFDNMNGARELTENSGASLCNDESDFEMPTENVNISEHEDGNSRKTEAHQNNNSSGILSDEIRLELDGRDENIDETELKLRYSSLTSCPTTKTLDAPKLVFKPSSIQNIMAISDETQNKVVTNTDGQNGIPTPSQSNCRKSLFKFPISRGTLQTKLHNPFIIPNLSQNSTQGNVVSSSSQKVNIGDNCRVDKDSMTARNCNEKTNTGSTPPEHSAFSGKFSLVKHMLSLQNEENFDKSMFENPLYSKPPNIKHFELMAERHKVVNKSDDDVIQYDLSAKQNIPIHWLGMSVAKKKTTESIVVKNTSQENRVEEVNTKNKRKEGIENCSSKLSHDFSEAGYIEEISRETSGFKNTEGGQDHDENIAVIGKRSRDARDPVQRGFQAIKSLVAQRHKNERSCESESRKSVLSNPFDYQNKQFQDDRSSCIIQTQSSQISTYSNSKQTSYKSVPFAGITEGNKHMYNLTTTSDIDISFQEENFTKSTHYRRQHSVESLSNSSYMSTGFPFPRNHSASSVASDDSASSVSFSRSYSMPPYSDSNPKPCSLVSDSANSAENCMALNLQQQQRMYHSCTKSFDSVSCFPQASYGESVSLVNHEGANRKSVTSHETGEESHESSDSDINVLLLYKNIAQLERLNGSRFNRNQMREFFTKQNGTENFKSNFNNKDHPQTSRKPEAERSHGTSVYDKRDTFSNVPVNQISQYENFDTDIDESSKFDAYNMIDSPLGTCNAHSSVSPNSRHIVENSNSNVAHNQEVQSVRLPSGMAELTFGNRRFDRNGANVNKNDSVSENQKPGSKRHAGDRCSVQQEHKQPEVSILDMLRLLQEGKGKEFDSIESLLGAYV